jgi:hypothetical protein
VDTSRAMAEFLSDCIRQYSSPVILSEAKDLRKICLSGYALLVFTDVVVENHATAI